MASCNVTAIEKVTGKSKHVTIANALQAKSPAEIAAARERIRQLYAHRAEDPEEEFGEDAGEEFDEAEIAELDEEEVAEHGANGKIAAVGPLHQEARDLLERSRSLLDGMHPDDVEEAIELREKITAALESRDDTTLAEAATALRELLFFVEGK